MEEKIKSALAESVMTRSRVFGLETPTPTLCSVFQQSNYLTSYLSFIPGEVSATMTLTV